MPGHSCSSKTGRRASGMTVIRRLRSARATSMAVVPPSRMTVSPSARRLAAAAPIVALALAALERPDAVRGLLGAEEDAHRPAVHTPEAPAALERLEITAHGHLGAIECDGQLSDQHRTALAEGLQDHLVARVHIHTVQSNIQNVHSHIVIGCPPIRAVVFDVGGVLLNWNPRNLYRKLFASESEMEWFPLRGLFPGVAYAPRPGRVDGRIVRRARLQASRALRADLGMVESQRRDDRWRRCRIGGRPRSGERDRASLLCLHQHGVGKRIRSASSDFRFSVGSTAPLSLVGKGLLSQTLPYLDDCSTVSA